jgi:transposase
MGATVETEGLLAAKFSAILPHLDERQRRLLMGAEARALGHGGIRLVARAAGVGESTVSRGVSELDAGGAPLGRTRRPGGGRKRAVQADPGLRSALLALVEPDERGDPMSPLRWTTKSTRTLAAELTRCGHRVSADTVGDLLRAEGFSLQGNVKTLEGAGHPDRDAQFRYLNEQARAHRDGGQPVISVDTKKKELVGLFASSGRQWRPSGEPVKVSTHDFEDRQLGKAVPYGVYDTAANTGWVNVGTDADTAAFAVESIRRWWQAAGRDAYPHADRLLITADAGGSNGYRPRAWKTELAALAAQTGLAITVCHLPPGTSKWNKIEHRLFSHITMNWRGRPLTSHEVIVNTIAATTTRAGLRVHAELDTGRYPTGMKVSDVQMAALPITRHAFHGEWNYTLHPAQTPGPSDDQAAPDDLSTAPSPDRLSDPRLTGMPDTQLHELTDALDAIRHARRHDHQQKATEQALRQGRKPHAPRSGRPPQFAFADQVLATVLHLRLSLPEGTLAVLFTTSRTTIRRAVSQTRHLLDQHGTSIEPITAPEPLTRLLTNKSPSAR